MKTKFRFFMEKCCACHACRVACMDQNDTDLANGDAPLRAVDTREGEENQKPRVYGISRACLHCEEPACAAACPSGCINKDGETGMVLADKAACTGCQSCAAACPYDAVFFDGDGKIAKCDGCAERVRNALEPACTRVCPTGALVFDTAPR